MADKISRIRVSSVDYELAKTYKTANVNSLENLDVSNDLIYATLSGPTTFSLSGEMEIGQKLTLIIEPTANFAQILSITGSIDSFDGAIYLKPNQICKLSIICYDINKYIINADGGEKTPYIIITTAEGSEVSIKKMNNFESDQYSQVNIPTGSKEYKISGLIHGFKVDSNSSSNIRNIKLYSGGVKMKMKDMSYMFDSCYNVNNQIDINCLDTSETTNMANLFYSCTSVNVIDMSTCSTPQVEDISYMFEGCSNLSSLDLSSFDISNVSNMTYMFSSCYSLSHIKCTRAFKDWCIENQDEIQLPESMKIGTVGGVGSGANWEIVDDAELTNYILASTGSNGEVRFYKLGSDGDSTGVITVPIYSVNYKIENLTYGLRSVYNDVNSAGNLISIDAYNFDTSNVINMSYVFNGCSSLTLLDLSNWNTINVTDMRSMFNSCTSLTSLDLSNFDTSKVTDMNRMFNSCTSLTSLDLSNFDTSKVTDMGYMFLSCTSLTSLDLSNFDTSKVTIMREMFYGCDKLNHIKCKQAFKDWCWENQSTINLPTTMQSSGSGTWEIVD